MHVTRTERSSVDRLLTPDEVCERLGVSDRWLRRQIHERRIEVVKVGALNRFSEAYIEAYVERQTRPVIGEA